MHNRILEPFSVACELSDVHIRNLKALPDRESLYKALPKGAIVAELGVASGTNAAAILRHAQPRELHLFDLWDDETADHLGHIQERFAREIDAGRVFLHRGDDRLTIRRMPHGYFDWVYLDTSHQYHQTKEELRLLRHKVKKGGLVCGHDYVDFDPYMHAEFARYRLKQCINEFCIRFEWEFIYLTMECCSNPSFAIRKIGHDPGCVLTK